MVCAWNMFVAGVDCRRFPTFADMLPTSISDNAFAGHPHLSELVSMLGRETQANPPNRVPNIEVPYGNKGKSKGRATKNVDLLIKEPRRESPLQTHEYTHMNLPHNNGPAANLRFLPGFAWKVHRMFGSCRQRGMSQYGVGPLQVVGNSSCFGGNPETTTIPHALPTIPANGHQVETISGTRMSRQFAGIDWSF